MEDGSQERSADIPPRDEKSADFPPPNKRSEIQPLTEQCALNQAVAIWSAQKCPAYNRNHTRLWTFKTWPHGMNPSPDFLSAAGFYNTGKSMFG